MKKVKILFLVTCSICLLFYKGFPQRYSMKEFANGKWDIAFPEVKKLRETNGEEIKEFYDLCTKIESSVKEDKFKLLDGGDIGKKVVFVPGEKDLNQFNENRYAEIIQLVKFSEKIRDTDLFPTVILSFCSYIIQYNRRIAKQYNVTWKKNLNKAITLLDKLRIFFPEAWQTQLSYYIQNQIINVLETNPLPSPTYMLYLEKHIPKRTHIDTQTLVYKSLEALDVVNFNIEKNTRYFDLRPFVLILLGEIVLSEARPKEYGLFWKKNYKFENSLFKRAEKYFRMIVKEYPNSKWSQIASNHITKIPLIKKEGLRYPIVMKKKKQEWEAKEKKRLELIQKKEEEEKKLREEYRRNNTKEKRYEKRILRKIDSAEWVLSNEQELKIKIRNINILFSLAKETSDAEEKSLKVISEYYGNETDIKLLDYVEKKLMRYCVECPELKDKLKQYNMNIKLVESLSKKSESIK